MKYYRANIAIACAAIIIVAISLILNIKFSPVASFIVCGLALAGYFFILIKQFPKEKSEREPKHYFGIVVGIIVTLVMGSIYLILL